MGELNLSLLFFAVVLMACVAVGRLSGKVGVPALLLFLALGMFCGVDGPLGLDFSDFALAEQICSVSLIFIMFYGGFGTRWEAARPVAGRALLLSTAGVVVTALLTAGFCRLCLNMTVGESWLTGAVISSTDAASVFSILRSRQLNLKYRTASLLEVESGSNDPCAYMLTAVVLMVMDGSATAPRLAGMLLAQIGLGVLFGLLIARAALWMLGRFPFAAGFDAVFVFTAAILAYAAPAALGGNGYLSAYLAGIVLGNRPLKNKAALVHFFDGVTGLMQMLIFFLLGLLSFPSALPKLLLPALLTALFLTFVARPAAVFLLLTPFRCPPKQSLLVSWAGLRGAASIVFAIMATVDPAPISYDIFHFVFCIVIFSILFQGSLLPIVAQKLDMIDRSGTVNKTFTDYQEEVPVQFLQVTLPPAHPWVGRAVREAPFPPGTLLVQLVRGERRLAPKGSTVLQSGDVLVLSAPALAGSQRVSLTELTLDPDHPWAGRPLSQLDLDPDKLIILIRRGEETLIPTGDTVLRPGDLLVINQSA